MTSPLEGFDFSYDPPDFAQMRAKGYRFCLSYLDYRGAPDGKCLTRASVRAIQNAGLMLALNLEVTSGRMKGGRKYGVADATDAANSITALGLPKDAVVYFSADFDAGPDNYPAIDAYLDGAASVLGPGRIGIYGSYRVIRHCQKAKTARWFWQTYAWSYGKVAPGIHAYQHQNHVKVAGGSVDLDWAYAADFGQITPELPESDTEEPVKFAAKIERWASLSPDGGPVTTLGSPLKDDGTPDFSQRLVIRTYAGKPVIEAISRDRLPATSDASLDGPLFDTLTSYAFPSDDAALAAAKLEGSEARAQDIRDRLGL